MNMYWMEEDLFCGNNLKLIGFTNGTTDSPKHDRLPLGRDSGVQTAAD